MNVELLKHCASDLDVANAARVSLDSWHEEFVYAHSMEPGEAPDDLLIGFLMKNKHGSPFEHGYFKFRVEAPIFVLREWHRHRVGHSYNEMSGRYTEMEKKFYVPDKFRMQVGKPGAYSFVEIDMHDPRCAGWLDAMCWHYEESWELYQRFLSEGMAKEQARIVLPLSLYSKMIWSCNPRSLMHFLSLRTNPQAMQEIRELAIAAENIFLDVMPVTANEFYKNARVAP